MSLETLISQVAWNCQAASAGQAGLFSLCGTLLRLRQLYKWEHRLPPWREPEPDAVLAWIENKERAWDTLEGQPWQPLAWGASSLDPFAVEAVNDHLLPQGLAYGAGLSRGLAPTCFLGRLVERRRIGDLQILVLGAELARDLDGTPALCQGRLIYARREAFAFYLWDRLADPGQQGNPFLKVALEAPGLSLEALRRDPEAHQDHFASLLTAEMDAAIHHEIGEALEPSLRHAFPAILTRFPQTRVELWARGLKDALAEVNEAGRLSYLIKMRQLGSLALMLAWGPGLYSLLLPELEPAFWELVRTGNWTGLEAARSQALARLRRVAAGLDRLLAPGDAPLPQCARSEIEQHLKTLGY